MDKFIIIVWHQAGGRNYNDTYYTWNDESECARVFKTRVEAIKEWRAQGMNKVHAGFVVNCSTIKNNWI